MQASNVSTPITERNNPIFGALELSQRSWLVTLTARTRIGYRAIRWGVGMMPACWR